MGLSLFISVVVYQEDLKKKNPKKQDKQYTLKFYLTKVTQNKQCISPLGTPNFKTIVAFCND